jgi:hypothetical protein
MRTWGLYFACLATGILFLGLLGAAVHEASALQPFAILLLLAAWSQLALAAPVVLFRPKWGASYGLGCLGLLTLWVVLMLAQAARSGFGTGVAVYSVVLLSILPAFAQIGSALSRAIPFSVRGSDPRGPLRGTLAGLAGALALGWFIWWVGVWAGARPG